MVYPFSIFLLLLSCASSGANYGINPTIVYKEHRIIGTEQLCPDLQDTTAKDIDTANYPYKSVFKLAGQVWKTEDPCVFESRGPRNIYTTVVIKAIQTGSEPWNYSGAQTCSEHIKLRLPSIRAEGLYYRTGLPLCTVTKPPDPTKPLSQNPFYNPHVWQLSKHKMGISFLLQDNETINATASDQNKEAGDGQDQSRLPKFIYIVFASFYGDTCSLRVQQYLVDPLREQCNKSRGTYYALCGMYNCSEEERILRQAGFWSDALRLSEIHKLIDVMRRKQYRSEPSFTDFLISLMRLMIMPIVFFVAYYVTRQLREKLANRQLMLHARNASLPINPSTFGGGSRVGISATIDSPASTRARFEDPPPAYYDTLISPPTYLEATTSQKPEDTLEPVASSTSHTQGPYTVIVSQDLNSNACEVQAVSSAETVPSPDVDINNGNTVEDRPPKKSPTATIEIKDDASEINAELPSATINSSLNNTTVA